MAGVLLVVVAMEMFDYFWFGREFWNGEMDLVVELKKQKKKRTMKTWWMKHNSLKREMTMLRMIDLSLKFGGEEAKYGCYSRQFVNYLKSGCGRNCWMSYVRNLFANFGNEDIFDWFWVVGKIHQWLNFFLTSFYHL